MAFIGTIFNPIASDSFGIDESGASYFVLALCIPQLGGSISLWVSVFLHVRSPHVFDPIVPFPFNFSADLFSKD